ncbi:MAG: type II toxin-antitoxin system VapC family toxin [Planctomycetes bacterium]|nr:type II toxin-antitoxin system VapC family toxin [Planctomycetota bacterium]
MYLIDTNIFLEILLDQERSVECQKLLDGLQDREVIFYVSSFTIHSIEVILERNGLCEPLMDFLYDIHKTKCLKRFDTNTLEELEAIKLSKKLNLDCDDAIQYYICKTYNFKIVSFDKHFDSTDVERIEPNNIIT